MKLSKKDIQHIANLARLDLTDEEIKTYGSQMSQVLEYMEELKEVDVNGVRPTAQVTGLENVAREDAAQDWPDDEVEASLNQASDREKRFIKVKRVL